MRLTVLYRDNSEHARAVTDFVEMLSRRYPGKTATLLDIDTREGSAEATVHGVVQYPAMLLISYDGRVMQQWEGLPLPLLDEVAGQIVEHQATPV